MTKRISIEGMSCDHCVHHVKEALSEVNGVLKVDVSLKDNSAIIEANNDVDNEDIIFAVSDAGYEVKEIEEV